MIVRCQLFAAARDLAGSAVVEVELPRPATIAQLRRKLIDEYPPLAPLVPHLMFAIDAEYVGDKAEIPAGAELAGIPPVSGG